jgi:uncharacterized protein YbjT (DUF2867 family)
MAYPIPKVFVSTVTGRQGGPLAHQLRKLDWSVSATVRDPEAPNVKALTAAGVKLAFGDWDNDQALFQAIAGCEKLFLCPVTCIDKPDDELRHAQNILKIAKAAGVKQVIVSTTIGVSTQGLTEHSDLYVAINTIKEAVEQAVQNSEFDCWTILRPAVFMSNFLLPQVDFIFPQLREDGVFKTALKPESKIALVDPTNIADMAAVIFQNPYKFNRQKIGVASDILSIPELLEQLSEATMRSPFQPYYMNEDEIDAHKSSFSFMHSERSLRYMTQYLDMEKLNDMVSLTGFKDWLREHKCEIKLSYA